MKRENEIAASDTRKADEAGLARVIKNTEITAIESIDTYTAEAAAAATTTAATTKEKPAKKYKIGKEEYSTDETKLTLEKI